VLKPINNLDADNQAKCRQNGWIAYDPKYGSSLTKKDDLEPGISKRYFLFLPNLMMIVIWAKNDREAITKANYRVK